MQGFPPPLISQGCMVSEPQFPPLHNEVVTEQLRVQAQRQNVDVHSHHRQFPNVWQISLCLSFLIGEMSIARLWGCCEVSTLVKSFLCTVPDDGQ